MDQAQTAGNQIEYFLQDKVSEWSLKRVLFLVMGLMILAAVGLWLAPMFGVKVGLGAMVALFSAGLVGLNTVAYEWPVAGATAPTAQQASTHQQVGGVVTGDGAATAFTFTHNFGLSTAELAAGFPNVNVEILLAAGNTALPIITSKTGNAVVFSCTAFTGAGLRVTCHRPFSMER